MALTPQGTEFKGPIKPAFAQGPAAGGLSAADEFIAASVISPTPAVTNEDFLHNEDPDNRCSITNTGNNTFALDLGSIDTRPLKAVVSQARSPYAAGNTWYLEYSDNNSDWTQGDTFSTTGNGATTMDAGTVSFRYCRCRYTISFATWNVQAYMGTINA